MVAIRSFSALGMLTAVVCHRIREDAGEVYPHDSNNQGCHTINSESQCISSMDGRPASSEWGGQYCAWCCGAACLHTEPAKCQPADWLSAHHENSRRAGYSVPGYKLSSDLGHNECQNSLAEISEVKSVEVYPHDSNNQGCHTINSESQCLSSLDGRRGSEWGGQYCAWCCGSACLHTEPAKCQPRDWLDARHANSRRAGYSVPGYKLMWDLDHNECQNSLAEISDESAEVKSKEVYVHDSNNQGCHTINSESQCISSMDGRRGSEWGGQYCAWCCGAACLHTEPAKCQPADWLSAHHENSRRAGYSVPGYKLSWDLDHNECQNSLAEISDESAEVYPPNSNNQGCHTLNSESQCTSSVDGRSGSEWGGQWCAWCCGSACLHTEPAKCQPAEWLAHHHLNSMHAGYSVPRYIVQGQQCS